MGKITFADLRAKDGPTSLVQFPDGYTTQIDAGEYVIFGEKANLPFDVENISDARMTQQAKQHLSFSARRNNSRTKKTFNLSAHVLLALSRQGTQTHEEATRELSPDERASKFQKYEWPEDSASLSKRNRLITQQEFALLNYEGRRRFRRTRYLSYPKSNLAEIWRNAVLDPETFFQDILNHGRVITSTSTSVYRASSNNTFSTHALSGIAGSPAYCNARMNAIVINPQVFSQILSDNQEKWDNHPEARAAYTEGLEANTKVQTAVEAARSILLSMRTKLTHQNAAMDSEFYGFTPEKQGEILASHALAVAFKTDVEKLGLSNAPQYASIHKRQYDALVQGCNLLGHSESHIPSPPDKKEWDAAQDFDKNHDALANAASVHFNGHMKKRYEATINFDGWIGVIEEIKEAQGIIQINAATIMTVLEKALKQSHFGFSYRG